MDYDPVLDPFADTYDYDKTSYDAGYLAGQESLRLIVKQLETENKNLKYYSDKLAEEAKTLTYSDGWTDGYAEGYTYGTSFGMDQNG